MASSTGRHPRSPRNSTDRPEASVDGDQHADTVSSEENETSNNDIDGVMRKELYDFAQWSSMGKGLASVARVEPDGRISITLDLKKHLPDLPQDHAPDVDEVGTDAKHWNSYPAMSIVVMIVGSRGDVQPYVALGRRLKRDGHRLRIATHETFRSFVNENDLEFYDIGGDPRELMSYMVKNPGLVPGVDSLTNGDIGRKRTMLKQMMAGCWASCHSPCEKTGKAFIADVIISNPPAFAHIHCAEAMGIPVHMSFTMPWCPTSDFPHPLVNVDSSNAGNGLTNYLSYALTDFLTWHGMGDIINELRNKELGLPSLSIRSGPGVLDRLKVPWTYCMSPALVPKPDDWKNHIDVVGFYFLDLAASYQPPEDLAAFLASGDPPVYVGFGSVVVDNPIEMTKTVFEATRLAGVRVLVSAGWGGLGDVSVPSHVFIIGNVPHDWLFAEGRVSAVVHHGGAGTTAIGLFNGRPTIVVPFFGDQAFGGSMVHRAGAGPQPIPPAKLSVETLKAAIEFSVSPPARLAAQQLADRIRNENGVEEGAQSFYRHLPLLNMRCDLDPTKMAVWWSNDYCLKLSAFAAQTLAEAKILKMDNLDLHRTKEYELRKVTADPVTGGAGAIFWTVTHYYASIAEIFYSPIKGIVHTTTAIPEGIIKIITQVHEGFQNVPRIYGSQVRRPGKIANFRSGMKEAGKSLFYGYYDGITGLVTEPLEGARKKGFIGAVQGSARSFVNATMKPAAGIVGMVVYPIEGIYRSSVQSPVCAKQEHYQRRVRRQEGVEAVKTSSRDAREAVLRRFREFKTSTKTRRDILEARALEAINERLQDEETESPYFDLPPTSQQQSMDDDALLSDDSNVETLTRRRSEDDELEAAIYERDLAEAIRQSISASGESAPPKEVAEETSHDHHDSAFQHDLELAIRRSMADSCN